MNILRTYFKEIEKNSGLTKEMTQRLAIEAQNGNEVSKEVVLKNHLLLVAKIAKGYENKGVELADLLAEGNIGLMNSLAKWDSKKGASFTTCASWWIKQAIIRNCMHKNRIVRLPEHISELMRTDRIDFIYGEVNIDQKNSEGDTLADSLPDAETPLFVDEETMKMKQMVKKFINYLKPKEREIIELYFGLNGDEALDVKLISKQMDLTTTRINQLIRTSIQKMKEQKQHVI